MLDQLEDKIKEASGIAGKLPDDAEREMIQESIQKAGDSAKQAREEGVTEERLEKIQEELGKAMKKLGEKADIEKRKLDLAKAEDSKAKSGSAQVTVDEYAEYRIAGDGAKKQQIAIQEVLDLILESAQTGRRLIAALGKPPAGGKYPALVVAQSPEIISAMEKGVKAAEELRARSEGTPYSFFGLQAKAMAETGFTPAIGAVAKAAESADPVEMGKNLELADERLRWVISLIEKNKEQFEKMIEYEEVLQLAHEFKKMHTVTIEDMPPSECDCRSGPYAKLKMELSDADVQAEIAKLKLKREVLKRLSELLQKNPELRARYLAQSQESSKIYREELSRLRNQQLVLAEGAALLFSETKGAEAPYRAGPAPLPWSGLLKGRLMKFAGQTTDALGIARIWIPTETPVEQRKEIEDSLAALSQAVEGLSKADPLAEEEFGNAVTSVREAGKSVAGILEKPWWQEKNEEYGRFRFDDLKAMSDELDACAALARSLRRKEGHEFLGQLQGELNSETQAVAIGMMGSLAEISGVSPKADQVIEELDKLLAERLFPTQKDAAGLLSRSQGKPAMEAMQTAATLLEEATRLLDSAITEFIRTKSEQDALAEKPAAGGEAQPLPDPSKDQIEAALAEMLADLEAESRKSSMTKLGIGMQANMKVETDWEKESKDKEKPKSEREALKQQQQQQMKSAQQAAAAAGKAQQAANSRARDLAKQMMAKPTVPWKERDVAEFDGRNDWNTVPGQLKESLTQEFDSAVPEEFRSAIDDYFRIIAETNAQ